MKKNNFRIPILAILLSVSVLGGCDRQADSNSNSTVYNLQNQLSSLQTENNLLRNQLNVQQATTVAPPIYHAPIVVHHDTPSSQTHTTTNTTIIKKTIVIQQKAPTITRSIPAKPAAPAPRFNFSKPATSTSSTSSRSSGRR